VGYGYWARIISLQADGFHTVFDALSNVIGLIALGIARQPPDIEHPYGHRKLEVAASIVIGLFVLLGFFEVARAIWNAAGTETHPNVTPTAYGIVMATIAVNLGVAAWEHWAGKRYNSMLLQSDAAHTLSDSLAASSVLIGMYLVEIGIPVGDVVAALAVMLFIGMTAYRVLREGLEVIVDSAHLDPHRVREVLEDVTAVHSCHYVRSRGMPGHIHVDLHLTLDPDMRLSEAGEILIDVKERLREHFADIEDIIIQIEPHEREHVEDVPEDLV
ncbi:MAG: cation diffusion facilitator family transporter, partial [Bradymonadaceae bacterium]